MSLFYSLIAKNYDIVLCEYTEYSGNFQQITRMLLRKFKKNTNLTIIYDRYKYYYINEKDITYLCLTDSIQSEVAFTYLRELKRKFLEKYDYEKIASFCSYSCDFENEFRKLINDYNQVPQVMKRDEIYEGLNELKNIQVENVDQLLEKGQKLDIIAVPGYLLNKQENNINLIASQILKQKRKKQMKYILLFGCIIIFLLISLSWLI